MPNRISVPVSVPISSLVNWATYPTFDGNMPTQTVEWEADVITHRTYGSPTVEYERVWMPINLSSLGDWSPVQLAEMRQRVLCHAEANGMPTRWSEPTPNVSYPPTYEQQTVGNTLDPYWTQLGQLPVQTYNQLVQGAFMANNNNAWSVWAGEHDSTTGTSGRSYSTNYAVFRASADTSGSTAWRDWTTGTSVGVAPGAGSQASAQQVERMNELRQKKEKAKVKAEKLLLSLLDSKQKKEFAVHRTVSVQISPTQVFKIAEGRSGNIYETNPATGTKKRWCVHIKDSVPNLDNMVGQLLHLRTNPAVIMDMANPI